MANFKLFVMSGPSPGKEVEYNEWYNNQHLQDVVAVPGFLSAQRFRLNDAMEFEHKHRYLAIYELDGKAAAEAVAELLKRRGTDAMAISDALDLNNTIAGVFEPCSKVVYAPTEIPSTANIVD